MVDEKQLFKQRSASVQVFLQERVPKPGQRFELILHCECLERT